MNGENWRKSSYSGGQGGECVEVASWRKSTHSGGEGGQCVEVADIPGMVAVRDTADRDGCTLHVTAAAWLTLLAKIRG